jgi:hypothetical protein
MITKSLFCPEGGEFYQCPRKKELGMGLEGMVVTL